jgi:host factor-I protein
MAEEKKGIINIQHNFLTNLTESKMPLTVFLVNGFQIRGTLKSFDNFTIALESEGKQQVVYKHAISTIVPTKPVQYNGIR